MLNLTRTPTIEIYLQNKLNMSFSIKHNFILFMRKNINCMPLRNYTTYISDWSRTLPCLPNTNSSNDDQHFHTDHLNTYYRTLCTWPAYNQDSSCIPRCVTKTNIFLHNLYNYSKDFIFYRIKVKYKSLNSWGKNSVIINLFWFWLKWYW